MKGAGKPLLREPVFGYFFHGPDGMGGMNYPDPKLEMEKDHAVKALIDTDSPQTRMRSFWSRWDR